MLKKRRHIAITDLIRKNKISSQDILLQKLIARGFELTQATLSRDLKELKVGRIFDAQYGNIYILPETSANASAHPITFSESQNIAAIAFSHNLCVVKTSPGYATGVALQIDNLQLKEIIGTIAGDDTILIIPSEKTNKQQLKQALIKNIPALKEILR